MCDDNTEIRLPDYTQGTAWESIGTMGPFTDNGTRMSAALAKVEMHFCAAENTPPVVVLSSDPQPGQGRITIVNADTWEALILPVLPDLMPLTPGECFWSIIFTDADGLPRSPYRGTQKVLPQR